MHTPSLPHIQVGISALVVPLHEAQHQFHNTLILACFALCVSCSFPSKVCSRCTPIDPVRVCQSACSSVPTMESSAMNF